MDLLQGRNKGAQKANEVKMGSIRIKAKELVLMVRKMEKQNWQQEKVLYAFTFANQLEEND